MNTATSQTNSKLDLVLERVVDVPKDLVWAAWTQPEHLKNWFTPAPWQTVDVEIDLRPGGIFRTVMRSPEGQEFPGSGCILEVIPGEKLVWTSALGPGYRPNLVPASEKECDTFFFTAIILLEAQGQRTKYTAIAIHGDEASSKKHEQLGFHHGWGAALDQLVAMVKSW